MCVLNCETHMCVRQQNIFELHVTLSGLSLVVVTCLLHPDILKHVSECGLSLHYAASEKHCACQ